MLIVISGADDDHIGYVQAHLKEPLVLLDTRDVLTRNGCSYHFSRGNTKITKNGQYLEGVRSVWYRRAMLIQDFELPVEEGKKTYAQNVIKFFNRLVFAQFNHAFWVSDYFAIEKANDKLWQLQVASKVGFNVPDTLFTASADKALAFIRSHKSTIAKPNYSSRFRQNDKDYGFYTSYVDADTDFSGLHIAPAIFQAAVDVKIELRITVVGTKVFAAEILSDTSHLPEHLRDWRIASSANGLSFKVFDLTKKVADQCIKLVQALGLQFGAIDAIIDSKNKLWFLENNPNGQWSFIEEATELPIGKAIAELLERG